MRIDIPLERQDNPQAYIADHFSKEMVAAGMAFSKACYQHSKLSFREFEAARIRTAQINGCVVCKNWRSERDLPGYFGAFGGDMSTSVAANGPAPDEAFYQGVECWRESSLFTERERLAIEYAEGMGSNPHGIAENEDFWLRAKAVFSEAEIVDLTYCVASWMALGRVAHVLGLDGVCQLTEGVVRQAS